MENKNYPFVEFSMALSAKAAGYDKPACGKYHYTLYGGLTKTAYYNHNQTDEYFSAPLYSELIDWFRIKLNIHIWISVNQEKGFDYYIGNIIDKNQTEIYVTNEGVESARCKKIIVDFNFDNFIEAQRMVIDKAFLLFEWPNLYQ